MYCYNKNMEKFDSKLLESIREEYEKSLEILPTKRPNQYILCPIGLIGSGKTTVMKLLAKKLGLVRISADEIRLIMEREGYSVEGNPGRDLAMKVIDKYVRVGHSIAIDSDCASKIKELKKKADELNIKLIWLHIKPTRGTHNQQFKE